MGIASSDVFICDYDLALEKILIEQDSYRYGDTLTFEINVFNQGNMPVQNIEVTDYVPDGYLFVQALNLELVLLQEIQ